MGKTWLAKDIAGSFPDNVYLNYDSAEDREIIRQEAWLDTTKLLILDDLHKMPGWKNYLKCVYDTKPEHLADSGIFIHHFQGSSLFPEYCTIHFEGTQNLFF